MEITLKWTETQQVLVEKLLTLARQSGKSPEEIVTEAVERYVEEQPLEVLSIDCDPLVGLFANSSDLSVKSSEILQQEITEKSGWTWKENQ
ncbi:hypothetical protein [Crocosphaera sp. Alani8]|uniref:hypothetical protein n=1 Tax=Crocosphaera sp. Alani8 TaxID=3038952 RepID=UPI00313ADB1A